MRPRECSLSAVRTANSPVPVLPSPFQRSRFVISPPVRSHLFSDCPTSPIICGHQPNGVSCERKRSRGSGVKPCRTLKRGIDLRSRYTQRPVRPDSVCSWSAKTQYSLRNAQDYFEEHLAVGDYYDEGQRVSGEWWGTGGNGSDCPGKSAPTISSGSAGIN